MAIVSSCQNWDHLQFLIIAIVVAGLITGVYILASITLSEATDPMDKVLGIKSALVTVPNDILYLSVLVSPSLFLLLYRGAGLIVRTLALAYLITAFVTIVYLQSRQAVGVYILSVLVFCFWLRPLLGLWVALGLLFAVLILDWFFGGGLIGKLVVLFPRRYVWDAAWHMFLDSPITGLGPGEFKENYQAYLVKAGYLSVEDHRPMKWAHSLYFEQLAERGGIGLLALMVLLGRPLGKLLTNLLMQFKKNGRMLRSNSYLYDIVWISTLTALLISGIGEASLMRIWVVTTIFMSIGIIEVVSGMALRNGQGAA